MRHAQRGPALGHRGPHSASHRNAPAHASARGFDEPTAVEPPSTLTFAELGLSEILTRAVAERGYERPSPIQAKAIPPALAGHDVLGTAQTGTGKTAAFALPILERLMKAPRAKGARHVPRVLVLCPTRELASQIEESFIAYGKHAGLRTAVVFGGVGIGAQRDALKQGVDILVATPGRLLDLMGQRCVSFENLDVLVLDEADRMLDMGFLPDVKRILGALPKQRQTLFFSATMPPEIQRLTESILVRPVRIAVAPVAATAEKVEQFVFHTESNDKAKLLAKLLSGPGVERMLVFTRTKRGADRLAKRLSGFGFTAAVIHGNKSQNARERALETFKSGSGHILVATDIAARGIDVTGITHVVNFDLPNEPEAYVHRIGRTARAERSGVAWSLCSREEREFLRLIERLIRKPVPVAQWPEGPEPVERAPAPGTRSHGTDSGSVRRRSSGRGAAPKRKAGGGPVRRVPPRIAARRRN